MANTKSAAKRARQTSVKTAHNASIITAAKSQQKRLRAAIAKGVKAEATVELQKLASIWDKAAKRGVVHQNAANRRKSIYNKSVAALS